MLDQKSAILLSLVQSLREAGSWTGETHVQKAMFYLTEKLHVDTGFNFVLYKHGPYSFDLHDELSTLFGLMLVEQVHTPPYGPQLKLTMSGKDFLAKHPLSSSIADPLTKASRDLGAKGVAELEKLATALWFKRQDPLATAEDIAESVNRVKPHIPVREALSAVQLLEAL